MYFLTLLELDFDVDEELEKVETLPNIENKSLRNINCMGLGGKNENI